MSQALIISRAQIREVLRENPELHMMVLEEGALKDAWEWLKEQAVSTQDFFKDAFEKIKQEWHETKLGKELLVKAVRGENISEKEMKFMLEQAGDVLIRMPVLGTIFLLPGGIILISAIVKIARKLGVEMMPSAFR